MDELLYDRVKQLREIDDRLERIEKKAAYTVAADLRSLRLDLAVMIQAAEEEHARF